MFISIEPAYIVAAMFFLACGCYLYLSVVTLVGNSEPRTKRDYLATGICLFLFSLSYGLMMITVNVTLRRVFWAIGYSSGLMFFPLWIVFLLNSISVKRRLLERAIKPALCLAAIIAILCVWSDDAVFTLTRFGNRFSYHNSAFFIIAFIFTSIIIVPLMVLQLQWWREAALTRHRRLAIMFLTIAVIAAPVGFITDFIVPIFTENTVVPLGPVSILASAALIYVRMMASKSLSITVQNVSGYTFSSVMIPILVLDQKNNIGLENQAAASFFGGSVLGKNIASTVFVDSKPPYQNFFEDSFASETVTIKTPLGLRICDMLLTVERDKHDDALCKVAIIRDVTESVAMVQELRDTSDQLQEALQQATAASQAKSDFLSNMSHEMRTPMNAIIGMTAIAKKADSQDEKNHALNKIGDASSHLLGVINDVLDMAKIEANKLELIPVEFSFGRMLQKVVTVINFRLDEKQQLLTQHVDSQIPRYIVGDDQRLAQVIANLMANAVKFTPEGGNIHFEASLVGEDGDECELCVEVAESGIGISPEQQKRLFNAFEQAETGTSREYGGTGLGLVISKRIVELMGGEIWVESELGKGSKFIFTMKALRGKNMSRTIIPVSEAAEDRIADLSTESSPQEFAGKRLLVVEDIEINREILVELLKDTGLVIECAENGKEALDMVEAASEMFDIVLMDMQMPQMDGLEATRRIRELPGHSLDDLPIVAMSANVFKDDIENCLTAGMNDHLGKPLDIDKVIEMLRQYL